VTTIAGFEELLHERTNGTRALSSVAVFFSCHGPRGSTGIFADQPHCFLNLTPRVVVFCAALATWVTVTVIGILRLWSLTRYSIQIYTRLPSSPLSAVFNKLCLIEAQV